MDADPAQAISGARALIGATTKLVLNQLGVAYDEQANVPTLVKAAQKALGLHPETLAPTGKGSETVRRVLSNLSQVAVGVAELRNEYGPDHGRTRVSVLSPRHAHLPVGCAGTYCRLLLETLADPDAPWRRAPRIVPREDVRFHGYLSTECPIGQVGWTVASGDVGDDRGAAGTGAERWLRGRINPASTRVTAWICHSALRMRLLGQPVQRRGTAVASLDALPCSEGVSAGMVIYTATGGSASDRVQA